MNKIKVTQDGVVPAPKGLGAPGSIAVGTRVHGRYPTSEERRGGPCAVAGRDDASGGCSTSSAKKESAEWRRATVVELLDDTEHHPGALGNGGPGYRLDWEGIPHDDPNFAIRDLSAANVRLPTDENDAYIRLNDGPGSATRLGQLRPGAREALVLAVGMGGDGLVHRLRVPYAARRLLLGVMLVTHFVVMMSISNNGFAMPKNEAQGDSDPNWANTPTSERVQPETRPDCADLDASCEDLVQTPGCNPSRGSPGVAALCPLSCGSCVQGTLPRFEENLPWILAFPFVVGILVSAFHIPFKLGGCSRSSCCGAPGAGSVIWFVSAMMTVVPMAFFTASHSYTVRVRAQDVPKYGALGVACFVFTLWSVGWAYLWFRAPRIQPIQEEQRLLDMPPGMGIKLFAVVSECFNYCGFSFFPALPWKAMEVPPSVPNPQVRPYVSASSPARACVLNRRNVTGRDARRVL
jgi:hypothetical protein